jgi:sporulation related protein
VSSVETPPPPTPVERRCPRCGAQLSAEQEWCLECGAAVGTRVAEPRGWRAPLLVIGVLLALALIAVVLAIFELSRDAEGVQEVAVTPTPAPSVVPSTTPTPQGAEGGATPSPAPTPSTTPSATPSPEAGGAASPGLTEWPEGKTAWTVVLNSSGTREDAERLAGELAAKGVPDVGVLDSNDFESLGPDSFVVFSGTYDTEAAAEEALGKVRDQAGGGSTRRIVPSK